MTEPSDLQRLAQQVGENHGRLIETTKETKEAAAAIESFRNEMVEQGNIALALTMGGAEKTRDQGSGIRTMPLIPDP